jgi:hypothetical protein
MRKIIAFLFIAFIIVGLSACKKDPNAMVVGKWYVKKITSSNSKNGVESAATVATNFSDKDYYQFNSNGTGGEYTTRYSVSDPNYASITDATHSYFPFTYSISGSNLNVSPNFIVLGYSSKLTIRKPDNKNIIVDNEYIYNSSSDTYIVRQEMMLSK